MRLMTPYVVILAWLLLATVPVEPIRAEGSAGDAIMPAVSASAARVPQATAAAERLQLDPTAIRGNQELPKVLYIVPWKHPGLAQPGGRPLNSLLDEALAPVDRDVFRRQIRYFDQLYGGGEAGPAPARAGHDGGLTGSDGP